MVDPVTVGMAIGAVIGIGYAIFINRCVEGRC
jgi:hypothetical protein